VLSFQRNTDLSWTGLPVIFFWSMVFKPVVTLPTLTTCFVLVNILSSQLLPQHNEKSGTGFPLLYHMFSRVMSPGEEQRGRYLHWIEHYFTHQQKNSFGSFSHGMYTMQMHVTIMWVASCVISLSVLHETDSQVTIWLTGLRCLVCIYWVDVTIPPGI